MCTFNLAAIGAALAALLFTLAACEPMVDGPTPHPEPPTSPSTTGVEGVTMPGGAVAVEARQIDAHPPVTTIGDEPIPRSIRWTRVGPYAPTAIERTFLTATQAQEIEELIEWTLEVELESEWTIETVNIEWENVIAQFVVNDHRGISGSLLGPF